jgi:opacity protein-like surface antigen
MKRMFLALAASVLLAGSASAAERYTVEDTGGFGSTGRFVEFASRYGWNGYRVDFTFGLDLAERSLTRDSKLTLTITRRDGSVWEYKCKASRERDRMWANINLLYSKGVSVMTECSIDPRRMAKAVDMEEDMIGQPTLVFHVMVKDGKATAGVQKGLYFTESGETHGVMQQYMSRERDPSDLGVLFASALAPYANHPEYAQVPRYIP